MMVPDGRDKSEDSGKEKKKAKGWGDDGAALEFVEGIKEGTWKTLPNPVRWLLGWFGGDSR